MEEVARSTRVSSTACDLTDAHLAGFVAGEGCFSITKRAESFIRTGTPRLRFAFSIEVAVWDTALVVALRDRLDAGRLEHRRAGKAGWQPTVRLSVSGEKDHLTRVIPFMEENLLPCAKRVQFVDWRDALLAYRQDRPSQYGRGPSPCSEPGCGRPVRGRGLCRHHYYLLTGY